MECRHVGLGGCRPIVIENLTKTLVQSEIAQDQVWRSHARGMRHHSSPHGGTGRQPGRQETLVSAVAGRRQLPW